MNFESFEDFLVNNYEFKEKYFEFDTDIEKEMSNLIYIPTDNRLAHVLKTYLKVETIDFNENIWNFKIIDENKNLITEILINLEKPLEDLDVEVFELIVQICLNGNKEVRKNLDRLGVVTNSSVWRCEYCGGVFGNTYNDCILHEENCSMNPKNIKNTKQQNGNEIN